MKYYFDGETIRDENGTDWTDQFYGSTMPDTDIGAMDSLKAGLVDLGFIDAADDIVWAGKYEARIWDSGDTDETQICNNLRDAFAFFVAFLEWYFSGDAVEFLDGNSEPSSPDDYAPGSNDSGVCRIDGEINIGGSTIRWSFKPCKGGHDA